MNIPNVAWLPLFEFSEPAWLWAVPPAFVAAVVLSRLARRSWFTALLRAVSVLLILAALAGPLYRERSTSEEIAAIVDVSASISTAGLEAFSTAIAPYAAKGAVVKAYPFGGDVSRSPVVIESGDTAPEIASELRTLTKGVDTGETNLESALAGVASKTSSSAVLVLSDGYQTKGDASAGARTVAQQGIRLFPLLPDESAFREERLAISSLYAPVTAHSGEAVEARAVVSNSFSDRRRGTLEMYLGNEKLYSQSIEVAPGEERVSVLKIPTVKGGLQRIRTVLKPDIAPTGGGADEQYRWISVKEKAKMLLLSGTKEDERLLKQIVSLKGFGLEDIVTDGSKPLPTDLSGYSSVVVNNVSSRQLSKGFLEMLKQFTAAGGGVLLIGGDRSYGLGGYIDTPLEEISPLRFVPPQTEKRRLVNAVALVIDKSRSMGEDNRIVAAKMAAMASIASMKQEDYIGIIGFDAGPTLALDVMPVPEAKVTAEARLRDLTPYGKTNLLPALALARQRLGKAPASRRHIVVLSDGKFPLTESEYIDEINRLAQDGISVSAIAVGLDADVPFMKLLAKYGKGAFYQTLDPRQLPSIFVEDIKVTTGERTLKEGIEMPVGPGPAGPISTQVEGEPAVKGFVETLPKKGSALELIVRREDKVFPLLASWSYEKGRVIAFTSDANGRWSLPWVSWRGFSQFWGDLLESVKDRSNKDRGDVDFDLRYRVEQKRVIFDLAIFDSHLLSGAPPRIIADITEPGNEQQRVSFQQIKPGRFEGVVEKGRPGDYRLTIHYGDLKFPALAVTLNGRAFGEIQGQGIQVATLDNLARLTGGRMNPDLEDLRGISRESSNRVFFAWVPALLAFAFILLEALIREGASPGRWLLRRVIPLRGRSAAPLRDVPIGSYERQRKRGGR